MTISATEALYSGPYAGDGIVVDYDYDFKIYDADELIVTRTNAGGTEDVLVRTTHYTVAGVGDAGGGSITLVSGATLPSGATLLIEPNIAMSQSRPFSSQSSLTLSQIEAMADKLTSLARQLLGLSNRALMLPTGETGTIVAPPEEGMTLIGRADGLGWETGPSGTAIEASAAAALASEIAAAASETASDASAVAAAASEAAAAISAAEAAASAGSFTLASQAEAEAGTDNTKYLSALRTAQAITAQALKPNATELIFSSAKVTLKNAAGTETLAEFYQNSGVYLRHDNTNRLGTTSTGVTTYGAHSADTVAGNWIASQAEAEAGTATDKVMTPQRVAQAVAALAGAKSVQTFTASGTWTRPSGVTKVLMFVTGGGGKGDEDLASGGSGGGATAIKFLDVSSIASATITVGAAKTGSTAAASAGNLSRWSDGTNTITANGGATSNSVGATASGGDLNIQGGRPDRGYGGNSFWGQGADGVAGEAYGVGGGGNGGAGTGTSAAGVVYVLEF